MQPSEIAASYDEIASLWADEKFNRANGIAQHRKALQFAAHGGRALDVGCGSSGRFIDLLAGENFKVEGLDISSEMIRMARLRHPDVAFHQADICKWEPAHAYDFITAWDSIWHVPLEKQEFVLKKLCRALTEGGVFISTTGGLDAPTEKQDSEMGPPMYYSVLGIPETLRIFSEAGCVCRHLEYDQLPELHVTIIVQRRADPPIVGPES
jgi:SAM-dependent methyltransferase